MRIFPWKRPETADREVVEILENAFGKEIVQVKQPGFGGTLSLIRTRSTTAPPRGQIQLLDSYATQPWVRAVVGKISEGVASAEWEVFRAPGKTVDERARNARRFVRATPRGRKRLRKAMKLEPLEGHEILDLMEAGNFFHEGFVLAELTQVHQELVGEGFWLKERDGRQKPVALWNIPPVWVAQTPVPGTEIDFFTFRVDGVLTSFPATEVIWFQKPSALTPYKRGVGVGNALSDEMDLDEYTAKMAKQYMVGGAIPDLIVSADGLSPDSTKRLEEDWVQKSQGFWKRFKPYFMNKKVEVTKLTSSFKDLQLDKLRSSTRDIIVHTWGVSPEIMGIVENSNRATIEGAFFQFSRWVLVPRLEFKRVTLQARLVPDFGDPSLILDYVSPVEEDREHILKVMTARPDAFLIDEWREEGNRGELPKGAGQVFATAITTRYVRELLPEAEADPPPADDPPPDDGEEGADDPPSGAIDDEDDGGQGIGRGRKQDDDAEAEERANALSRAARDAVDPEEVENEVRPVLAATVLAFGEDVLTQSELATVFDSSDPEVAEYLLNGYRTELQGVSQTTKDRIEEAIRSGVLEGLTLGAIVTAVRAVFSRAREKRSATIARSGTVQSANFGTVAGFIQAGIPLKDWVSERDGLVRDTHVELDQQDPIPVTDDFVSSSGAAGPRPGSLGTAAEDANCRCWVLPAGFVDDEARSLFDTEEKRTDAWKGFETMRQPFEELAIERLDAAFKRQENAVVTALRGIT